MTTRLSRALALACALTAVSAQAIELRSGYGGTEGYGNLAMNPNDDGSSNQLNLPFALNFFGNTYDKFFVNNNGNISFNSALSTYRPQSFPIAAQPMIAPYWGDVDTSRQPGGGAVYVASPDSSTVVVTWHNVGVYPSNNTVTNDFQMTLLKRDDTGSGNFDIEFRYNRLQWTYGSASNNVPAQAGYDAGDRQHYFALPGSMTGDVLRLANTSNVSNETPGLWTMAIRNGAISDGSSEAAPLLPTIVQDNSWQFNFNIRLGQRIFIDPLVAVGYDYVVSSGPNMRSVVLPSVAGDTDGYDIMGWNDATGQYDILLGHVAAGEEFDFGPDGIRRFGVRDIDVTAGLDPDNRLAFVTGLTFTGDGTVAMTQTPVSVDVQSSVPEPSTLALLASVMVVGGMIRRRRTSR